MGVNEFYAMLIVGGYLTASAMLVNVRSVYRPIVPLGWLVFPVIIGWILFYVGTILLDEGLLRDWFILLARIIHTYAITVMFVFVWFGRRNKPGVLER